MPTIIRVLRAVQVALVLRFAEAGFAILLVMLSSLVFAFGFEQASDAVRHIGWSAINVISLSAGFQVFSYYLSSNYALIAFLAVLLAHLLLPTRTVFLCLANSIPLVVFAVLTMRNPTMPFPFAMATDVIDNHKVATDFVWIVIALCNFFLPTSFRDKQKA